MITMGRVLVASAVALVFTLTACSSEEEPQPGSAPAEEHEVPTTTGRVYLATAIACRFLDREDVTFTPLRVDGPDYSVTVEPTEDCEEQAIFNTYVFDVPLPKNGMVTVTPGDQPAAELDAASVALNDGVTVFYARVGDGEYVVSVIQPGRDDHMGDAGTARGTAARATSSTSYAR